jgi:phytoene dehydrogenase-like protein
MARKARDAVVIGAGPNGLVAANLLTDAGWDVVVLETQDHVGGGVYSDESVEPGFVHDTFSSFYPLAGASPVIKALELEKHGLVWTHAPAVLGNPLPDGSWAMLYRDLDRTVDNLNGLHAGDGDAWRAVADDWHIMGPAILEALLSPFPPVRGGLKALARLPRVGGLDYVRTLLEPAATMGGKRCCWPATPRTPTSR